MRPLASRDGAEIYHAHWRDLAAHVGECDALIVDAPYSERTHSANDGAARRDPGRMRNPEKIGRALNYAHWTPDDVSGFVAEWAPRTRGWVVSITDHTLAASWARELEVVGMYVFAPLAFVAPGSRIRLSGDGPSQWATWVVAARPRKMPFAKWGTLPGAYVLPAGYAERMDVVGGKPAWLMRALIRDYSRPGDLVVDPCCGAGTTAIAAVDMGRRAACGDLSEEHAQMAARRLTEHTRQARIFDGAEPEQLALTRGE